MASTFRRDIQWNAIGKTSPISSRVQTHLTQVYTTLAISLFFAALGAVFFLRFQIAGLLPFLGSIGAIFWLSIVPKSELGKRTAILCTIAFLCGMNIGPLLQQVIQINPAIITSAFLGTVCIFACFSASAYFATRRSYLFLGGLLGSALSTMLLLNLLNIFMRSMFVFNMMLYLGLLVFCAYVMFDTQLIIEKASSGEYDVVWDSLELFLDFVNIFVRLVIILSKDNKKK